MYELFRVIVGFDDLFAEITLFLLSACLHYTNIQQAPRQTKIKINLNTVKQGLCPTELKISYCSRLIEAKDGLSSDSIDVLNVKN